MKFLAQKTNWSGFKRKLREGGYTHFAPEDTEELQQKAVKLL